MTDLETLQERIGYRFVDEGLLQEALTHKSFAEEVPGCPHNQRLEFLGDAVASLVVARGLFVRRPDADEGLLTRLRVALVEGVALSGIGRDLELDRFLRTGVGVRQQGDKARATREGDCLEALVGAAFLDGGYEVAADILARLLEHHWDVRPTEDPKVALNELCQRRFGATPTFFGEGFVGRDDLAWWTSRVRLPDGREFAGEDPPEGDSGGSKKTARRRAAASALEALRADS